MRSTDSDATVSAAYDELVRLVREGHLLGATSALLGWDQQVMMPAGGVDLRSRQLAQIAGIRHARLTSLRVGELLAACEGDPALIDDPLAETAVNIREIRRQYDRETRLPSSLVEEEARLASVGEHAWAEARKAKDFALFRPALERIVELLRRKAECYGWAAGGEPWDALAEDYEPGCTAADVAAVFTPLRERLRSFLEELMGSGTAPSTVFNDQAFDIADQQRFVRFVAETIGFDFARGRLDTSTHPFCSGTHPGDVRLTTRFQNTFVFDALGSTMHECGHGIYEQGLRSDHWGTPMGQAVSLGIHESQSRLWENQVGRSRAFWQWCQPHLRSFFGRDVERYGLDELFGAANAVKPDFIRVEADEATYNMHIMVRFELERLIMRGDLAVADIPDAWSARYREYLGVEVPDDAKGCLQDIHWSMVAMGYFPTYTLGTLYAAQFFERAERDIPDLHERFSRGEFTELKRWLNERIHGHGQRYRAEDLCRVVTGSPLSADPMMRHLEAKLRPLYRL